MPTTTEKKRITQQVLQAKTIDRENFRIRFILSSPAIDRHGEVVDQKGWHLDNYLKNPVVLWGHNQDRFAVGKMVDLGLVEGNLEGTVEFAAKQNPDAAILFELYADEFMRAGSVGFMNLKWMFDEEKDLLTLLENELFEFSLCNIPANPQALAKAKAKGIDVDGAIERLNKGAHDAGDRFKNLGEEAPKEDAVQVPPDGGEQGADVQPETKPTKEGEEEEAPADAAATDAGEKEVTDEQAQAALAVLCNAKGETIKAAVKELTGRLIAAGADGKEKGEVDAATPTVPAVKKIRNADINRVIRSLLNGKEKNGA